MLPGLARTDCGQVQGQPSLLQGFCPFTPGQRQLEDGFVPSGGASTPMGWAEAAPWTSAGRCHSATALINREATGLNFCGTLAQMDWEMPHSH